MDGKPYILSYHYLFILQQIRLREGSSENDKFCLQTDVMIQPESLCSLTFIQTFRNKMDEIDQQKNLFFIDALVYT